MSRAVRQGLLALARRDFLRVAGVASLVACGDHELPANASGARVPSWTLRDVQPASARFDDFYGLEAFRGSALLVALLAGGCESCQVVAAVLDALERESRAEGLEVRFCAINDARDASPELLVEHCSFPVFQDTPKVRAWERHAGTRDDLYVYSAGGRLIEYFALPGGVPDGDPLSDAGRANLKGALSIGA